MLILEDQLVLDLETARATVEAFLDARVRPQLADTIVVSRSAETTEEFVFFYQTLSFM